MEQNDRIEKLKSELRRLNGGEDPPLFGIDTMPQDMAEQFLERIIAVETGQAADKIAPLSNDGTTWHVAIPTKRAES